MVPTLLDKTNISKFISSIDYILTDCDGVIWRGDTVVEGAPEAIAALQALGKQIFYVSNNSTKTIKQYITKLDELGFQNVVEDDVYSSAVITSMYITKYHSSVSAVYVVGSEGLRSELKRFNPNLQILFTPPGERLTVATRFYNPQVELVVVGFDSDFNYEKLTRAMGYLQRNSCRLLVSNNDTTFPTDDGFLPGTGSIVSSIITASNQQPIAICGKPSPDLVDVIQARVGVKFNRAKTIMIGDRLNSDILMSHRANLFASLLVLTGCDSDLEDVAKQCAKDSCLTPTYYIESLADIKSLIENM